MVLEAGDKLVLGVWRDWWMVGITRLSQRLQLLCRTIAMLEVQDHYRVIQLPANPTKISAQFSCPTRQICPTRHFLPLARLLAGGSCPEPPCLPICYILIYVLIERCLTVLMRGLNQLNDSIDITIAIGQDNQS